MAPPQSRSRWPWTHRGGGLTEPDCSQAMNTSIAGGAGLSGGPRLGEGDDARAGGGVYIATSMRR